MALAPQRWPEVTWPVLLDLDDLCISSIFLQRLLDIFSKVLKLSRHRYKGIEVVEDHSTTV